MFLFQHVIPAPFRSSKCKTLISSSFTYTQLTKNWGYNESPHGVETCVWRDINEDDKISAGMFWGPMVKQKYIVL
jgi:hypothetical protein